jgi:hypothetical protein
MTSALSLYSLVTVVVVNPGLFAWLRRVDGGPRSWR